jgi:hypothetical protein
MVLYRLYADPVLLIFVRLLRGCFLGLHSVIFIPGEFVMMT